MNTNTINLTDFPTLKTERFDLVEIKENHLDSIFELYNNHEVTKYIDLLPLKHKEEAKNEIDFYKKRFTDSIGIRWGIVEKNQTNIIGTLGYNKIFKDHKGRIGYDLLPKYWGKGVMTEALESIITYGFNEFNISRIEAEVMQGNIGSEKLLSKLKFQKEGVLRNWMFWNEQYYDISMFSLVK